jgi:competence protein ComEC
VAHLSSLLTLALAAGVAGGVSVDAPVAFIVALTMSAAWSTALLSYLRGFVRMQLLALCALVGGAGWVLGAHAVAGAEHPPLRAVFEQRVEGEPLLIEGRLREDAALTGNGAVLRLDVERLENGGAMEATEGGIAVGVGGAMQPLYLVQWTAGRVVRAPVVLRRPVRYLNAGLPDQERALARRGISLVGTIKSATLVEVVERGSWWQEAAASIRARTRAAIDRHVAPYGAQSAAIATAILIGDRAALTPGLELQLQEAGTYHVIAISGGNIAILAGLCLGGLRLLGIRGRLASIAAIATLGAYSVIAIGGASVMRATLMAVIYLAVRLIDQRTAPANAISLTAAIVLLTTPLAIVDVGFWLTFGATVALLAASALPQGSVMFRFGILRTALLVVAASVCVELVLAPIAAFVFQRVTMAGLLLNVVAIPSMTIVQVGAMGVVASDVLDWLRLAGWLGLVVHLAGVALTESGRALDYAPWLTWRAPSPHLLLLAVYYVALGLACVSWLRGWPIGRRRTTGVGAAILFVWIVAAPGARVRARGDGTLHLTLFDVGQGDALLATFPNGRTLAIDTGASSPGGDFDIGDRVIGPALRARGLLALDYLAVTHGDPDHIGGALALVRDFLAGEVWWGIPVANHAGTAAVRSEADIRRIGWRTLQRGDRLDIGDVEVRVHHPPPPDWERQRVRNNDSLVIELRYHDVSMLLTGDIGREVEMELLPALDLLPLTILKVAHHGSATSSTQAFLERVHPRVALVGVGRGNPYGHPVPQVLGRLHDAGAEVFRTDLDGQIEVVTDGRHVAVKTFTGRELRLAR